jgi:hypothetical protein
MLLSSILHVIFVVLRLSHKSYEVNGLKIVEVREAILVLGGQLVLPGRSIMDLSGFMDRMTGDMTVTATQRPPVVFTKTYSLKCTPAQRMF